MVHWFIVLGAGLGGLAVGLALGYWTGYKDGRWSIIMPLPPKDKKEKTAKAEDTVSNLTPRFP